MSVSDWEERRKRANVRDITRKPSTLWERHTITALVVLALSIVYVAYHGRSEPASTEQNVRRALLACSIFLVGFGTVHLPDGPFMRPHPAFWRLILSLSILYEMCLIFLLFQTDHDVRSFLRFVDGSLGKPLEEKDYGGNCRIYDSENTTDPWHNVKDKLDEFVVAHLLGWWVRTLVFRDAVFCWVNSFAFEMIEYTLQLQLPNFTECWWDHWIMDFLVCNGLGIYVGLRTCDYLARKQREWRGVSEIPSIRDKIVRVALQFTPHHWIDFEWSPLSSLRRWLFYVATILASLIIETGTFYIKTTLWIPPKHPFCTLRLALCVFSGAVAIREIFELVDNPKCQKVGTQSWVLLTILFTEGLVVFKFGREILQRPIPSQMVTFWAAVFGGLVVFTVWRFLLKPAFYDPIVRVKGVEKEFAPANKTKHPPCDKAKR